MFKKLCTLFSASIILAFGFAQTAQADYVVWQDNETGFSLSYPDTWRQMINSQPYDVFTIAAPSPEGKAMCRASVHDDWRFAVYPPSADWAVQRHAYSSHFWAQYMAVQGYTNRVLVSVLDGAGFGRGFATVAMAEFTGAVPGPEHNRRAVMFASNYDNQLFIFECSATKPQFEKWRSIFMAIAKSVDFQKVHHELRVGHHFNFLEHNHYWNAPNITTDKKPIYFEGNEGDSWEKYE